MCTILAMEQRGEIADNRIDRRAAYPPASVTLRIAHPADRPALTRLAQLDSRALPPGPHLVAEREGRIDAALSLSSGLLVADPFRRTAELCRLLQDHPAVAERDGSPGAAGFRPRLATA
jgi:hypothetical protein